MAEEEKKYGVKEPTEGTDGKVASNMTGEAITGVFDYGSVSDEQREVVKEIIDLMRAREQIPCGMFAEELKTRFQLEEIPMKDPKDSVWGQLTKDERLGQSIQGFRLVEQDGKKIRIPHIGFSADLDYLDEFINRIVKSKQKKKD